MHKSARNRISDHPPRRMLCVSHFINFVIGTHVVSSIGDEIRRCGKLTRRLPPVCVCTDKAT